MLLHAVALRLNASTALQLIELRIVNKSTHGFCGRGIVATSVSCLLLCLKPLQMDFGDVGHVAIAVLFHTLLKPLLCFGRVLERIVV